MESGTVLALGREMLLLTLYLSVPIMVMGMAIGLIISIFQAMTQIQEQTLTFVPKIIAILVTIIVLLPWSLQLMVTYTQRLIEQMPGFVN